jgi:ABC-2 type transport system ATP-binding protein
MTTTTGLAIETVGLVKIFGRTRAVDGLDLAVPTGAVYGVLGPNGAGKTTTLRILASLLRPDGGVARVLGHDVVREAAAVRGRMSLTGQFASVDEDLTGFENLVLLGRLLGYGWARARERASELLEAFDLTAARDRQVKRYSGGMRRRLDVAASLIITPDLLLLDEPTTGLDPHSRAQVWAIVRAIAAQGTTVLLTTQYLDEADQLADRIAVINHGMVIAEGTSGQLKASVGAGGLRLRLLHQEQRPVAQRVLAQALRVPVQLDADPVALSARVATGTTPTETGRRVASALADLAQSGIAVTEFALGQPSLDEVFLALTGRPTGYASSTKERAS